MSMRFGWLVITLCNANYCDELGPLWIQDPSAQICANSVVGFGPGYLQQTAPLADWTEAEVQQWFAEFDGGLYSSEMAAFADLDGARLAAMTEADFEDRSPSSGGAIFTAVSQILYPGPVCPPSTTWHEADSLCTTAGGRLCKVEELLADTAKGSGCNLDNKRVWSIASCQGIPVAFQGGLSVAGSRAFEKTHPLRCSDVSSLLPVRCCAEFYPTKPSDQSPTMFVDRRYPAVPESPAPIVGQSPTPIIKQAPTPIIGPSPSIIAQPSPSNKGKNNVSRRPTRKIDLDLPLVCEMDCSKDPCARQSNEQNLCLPVLDETVACPKYRCQCEKDRTQRQWYLRENSFGNTCELAPAPAGICAGEQQQTSTGCAPCPRTCLNDPCNQQLNEANLCVFDDTTRRCPKYKCVCSQDRLKREWRVRNSPLGQSCELVEPTPAPIPVCRGETILDGQVCVPCPSTCANDPCNQQENEANLCIVDDTQLSCPKYNCSCTTDRQNRQWNLVNTPRGQSCELAPICQPNEVLSLNGRRCVACVVTCDDPCNMKGNPLNQCILVGATPTSCPIGYRCECGGAWRMGQGTTGQVCIVLPPPTPLPTPLVCAADEALSQDGTRCERCAISCSQDECATIPSHGMNQCRVIREPGSRACPRFYSCECGTTYDGIWINAMGNAGPTCSRCADPCSPIQDPCSTKLGETNWCEAVPVNGSCPQPVCHCDEPGWVTPFPADHCVRCPDPCAQADPCSHSVDARNLCTETLGLPQRPNTCTGYTCTCEGDGWRAPPGQQTCECRNPCDVPERCGRKMNSANVCLIPLFAKCGTYECQCAYGWVLSKDNSTCLPCRNPCDFAETVQYSSDPCRTVAGNKCSPLKIFSPAISAIPSVDISQYNFQNVMAFCGGYTCTCEAPLHFAALDLQSCVPCPNPCEGDPCSESRNSKNTCKLADFPFSASRPQTKELKCPGYSCLCRGEAWLTGPAAQSCTPCLNPCQSYEDPCHGDGASLNLCIPDKAIPPTLPPTPYTSSSQSSTLNNFGLGRRLLSDDQEDEKATSRQGGFAVNGPSLIRFPRGMNFAPDFSTQSSPTSATGYVVKGPALVSLPRPLAVPPMPMAAPPPALPLPAPLIRPAPPMPPVPVRPPILSPTPLTAAPVRAPRITFPPTSPIPPTPDYTKAICGGYTCQCGETGWVESLDKQTCNRCPNPCADRKDPCKTLLDPRNICEPDLESLRRQAASYVLKTRCGGFACLCASGWVSSSDRQSCEPGPDPCLGDPCSRLIDQRNLCIPDARPGVPSYSAMSQTKYSQTIATSNILQRPAQSISGFTALASPPEIMRRGTTTPAYITTSSPPVLPTPQTITPVGPIVRSQYSREGGAENTTNDTIDAPVRRQAENYDFLPDQPGYVCVCSTGWIVATDMQSCRRCPNPCQGIDPCSNNQDPRNVCVPDFSPSTRRQGVPTNEYSNGDFSQCGGFTCQCGGAGWTTPPNAQSCTPCPDPCLGHDPCGKFVDVRNYCEPNYEGEVNSGSSPANQAPIRRPGRTLLQQPRPASVQPFFPAVIPVGQPLGPGLGSTPFVPLNDEPPDYSRWENGYPQLGGAASFPVVASSSKSPLGRCGIYRCFCNANGWYETPTANGCLKCPDPCLDARDPCRVREGVANRCVRTSTPIGLQSGSGLQNRCGNYKCDCGPGFLLSFDGNKCQPCPNPCVGRDPCQSSQHPLNKCIPDPIGNTLRPAGRRLLQEGSNESVYLNGSRRLLQLSGYESGQCGGYICKCAGAIAGWIAPSQPLACIACENPCRVNDPCNTKLSLLNQCIPSDAPNAYLASQSGCGSYKCTCLAQGFVATAGAQQCRSCPNPCKTQDPCKTLSDPLNQCRVTYVDRLVQGLLQRNNNLQRQNPGYDYDYGPSVQDYVRASITSNFAASANGGACGRAVCTCGAPGYKLGQGGRSCTFTGVGNNDPNNPCNTDPCKSTGNTGNVCTPLPNVALGYYQCTCNTAGGWALVQLTQLVGPTCIRPGSSPNDPECPPEGCPLPNPVTPRRAQRQQVQGIVQQALATNIANRITGNVPTPRPASTPLPPPITSRSRRLPARPREANDAEAGYDYSDYYEDQDDGTLASPPSPAVLSPTPIVRPLSTPTRATAAFTTATYSNMG